MKKMRWIFLLMMCLTLCAAQADIVLPDDLTVIGEEAFAGDTSVTRIVVPDGAEEIAARAFAGSGLQSIFVPASVTRIDEDAFAGCPETLTVYCPAGSAIAKYCKDHGVRYQVTGARKVGISLPSDRFQRWANDGEVMQDAVESAGFDAVLRYADNDVDTQRSQVTDMINNGCEVVVIAAIEGSSLGSALDLAKEKNVTVIAYDRLLMNTSAVSYYVTFSSFGVGRVQGNYIANALNLSGAAGPFCLEITAGDPGDGNARLFYDGAMSVLSPYIKSGKLVVRSGQTDFEDVATSYWSTENAQARASAIVSSFYSDSDIDAWLCSNDSTALGVIYALENGYNNKWPVITGQDCDLENVRMILSGKQSMSVFKDTRIEAVQAAKMAIQCLKTEAVDVNDTSSYHNGTITVPAFVVTPAYVDIGNYQALLIDSGIYPADLFQ